jgi:hypothetical protein
LSQSSAKDAIDDDLMVPDDEDEQSHRSNIDEMQD